MADYTSTLGFLTHNVASLSPAKDGPGTLLAARGKKNAAGYALLKLDAPAAGPVEFRVRFKSKDDQVHNGGIAFGPSDDPRDLTRCQVFLGGKFLQIGGAGVPLTRHDAPDLDPAAEQECVVRVDPIQHLITFTVDKSSVQAPLDADAAPIRYYGYVVEKTTTQFGPIQTTPPTPAHSNNPASK